MFSISILISFDIAQYCIKIRRGLISVRLSARRSEMLADIRHVCVCLSVIYLFFSFFFLSFHVCSSRSHPSVRQRHFLSPSFLFPPTHPFPLSASHIINSISTFRPPPLLSSSICCYSGLHVCMCVACFILEPPLVCPSAQLHQTQFNLRHYNVVITILVYINIYQNSNIASKQWFIQIRLGTVMNVFCGFEVFPLIILLVKFESLWCSCIYLSSHCGLLLILGSLFVLLT